MLIYIHKNQKLIANFLLYMVKNGCGQSGFWTLKLTVSQVWKMGSTDFFAYWYKFMQIKTWLKIFEVGMFKYGDGMGWWDSKIDCI